MWSQKLPFAEQPAVGNVCLSWRFSQQFCIVHCTLCGFFSCRLFFLGSNVIPRGLCFVYIQGDPLPGGDLHCIYECLLCRSCQDSPVKKYLGCSPCCSSGGKTITYSYSVSRSWITMSGKWTPCTWAVFYCCVAKLAAVQVLFHRSDSVWWWLWAGGKTSFTQRSAVPLACSHSSPVVASARN